MPKTKAKEDLLIVDELQVDVLKIDGTEVAASADELNKLDGATVTVEEINLNDQAVQTLTDNGAITVKNGICLLNKAGIIAATLANPTATTDDFKRLTIRSLTAQAHTITVTGGFGNGGSGEDVATLSGVIGDGLELMAYQGYWYIQGGHQFTVA